MVSSAADWQSGAVPVSGGQLAYHRTGGTGPAMVLAHGLTDNGLCWSRLAEALADGFDVIMFDARGHGASLRMAAGAPFDPGQDLAEAIAGLGLQAPIVLGHSVGARAAARYAAANPGAAALLLLEDPPLLPLTAPEELPQRRERFCAHVAELQAMSAAELAALGRAQSPGWDLAEFPAWVQAKQQVDPAALPEFPTPWQQDFAALTVPCLLICGEPERGGMVTPALAAEAMALNPLIRAVRIDDAGHNVRRENFADYLAAVRSFLHSGGQQ